MGFFAFNMLFLDYGLTIRKSILCEKYELFIKIKF